MTIPSYAFGYGETVERKVFGLNIRHDLSSVVVYKCFDNDQTFPETEDPPLTTTDNIVLAGTTGSGDLSMVGLLDTSNAAPGGASWMPSAETGGSANPNLMNGSTSYVTQAGSISVADNNGDENYNTVPPIMFNMCTEVPSDVTTSSTMGFEVQITFTYTGSDPVPRFEFNDEGDGGDDTTPDWTPVTTQSTPGGHGLLHTRSGATVGSLYANIPAAGTEKTQMGWITAAP